MPEPSRTHQKNTKKRKQGPKTTINYSVGTADARIPPTMHCVGESRKYSDVTYHLRVLFEVISATS